MTELATHYERESLGNGRYRHTQHLRPIAYQGGDGILRRIVNDWVDGDQDSPHVVSSAPMRVRADGVGRRNIYPIPGNDEVYISVGRPWYQPVGGWQVAPMNQLTRAGNRLQSINANYNLYLDHAGHFAKLGILLKGGFVPPNSRFAFPVSLVGLTRQGNTILYNGQPVMTLRRPVVYDHANPEDERAITFNFGTFGSQSGVIFNLPDMTGMSQPIVDPTLTLQPGAADGMDTWLTANRPNNNAGVSNLLIIGGDGIVNQPLRSLLKFPVTDIPGGMTINDGMLTLYCVSEAATTDYGIGMHRSLVQWYEGNSNDAVPGAGIDASTWNNRNHNGPVAWTGGAGGGSGSDYAATATATTTITGTGTTFDWDVTADIAAWYTGTATNHGWFSITPDENTIDSRKRLAASDGATASQRPKLVIEYTLPAGRRIFASAFAGAFG